MIKLRRDDNGEKRKSKINQEHYYFFVNTWFNFLFQDACGGNKL